VKLRRLPEDFQVEELTHVQPDGGNFAFYRLTKQSIGTPEAISAIGRRLNIHRRKISYGGLKDRHAITIQYLTIRGGPRRGFSQKSFELEYLGQTSSPYSAQSFGGNRFQLVLRNMNGGDVNTAMEAVDAVRQTGVPNYFDDQRFGSLAESGDWIARAWCLGDYERALWLALADVHRADSAAEKKQKRLLQQHWNDWPKCKSVLDRSHRRSIVTYLSDKVEAGKTADCRGALARVNVDLRGLYLSAWQSALWNRIVSCFLTEQVERQALEGVSLISGEAMFPVQESDQLKAMQGLTIPLPSSRIKRPEGLMGDIFDRVLAEEAIELRQIRVKYPRDSFFSKASRAAMVQPAGIEANSGDDELYPGKATLTLRFDLPRGSYATILVKRITDAARGDGCT
jgi:tRNA pseudouridine13 synthase